jgi:predicted  nucleic acid-binding Zn-ribbon protein
MATTDTFEKLKKLQDILVEKYKLEAKIEETPKRLSSQEELLARMKREFIEKNTEYEAVKNKVLKLKLDLEEAVKSRESGEKGMDNISTHREYEALEKQIIEATDRENEIRKELQKEEKSQEEIRESLKTSEEMINSQEADLAADKDSLNKELDTYNKELTDIKAKESEIVPDLDQEILFKFQRIIQRNSMGIVAVKNGVCTGCHMILPAQFANTVREGENIMFCPYCSRILFYEEADEDIDESYFRFEETGSLADLDDDSDFDDSDDEEKEGYEDEYSDEMDEDSEYSDDSDEDEDLDDEDGEDEDAEEEDEE